MDALDRYIAVKVYGWTPQEITDAEDKSHQLCCGEGHKHTVYRSNQIKKLDPGVPCVIAADGKAKMSNHIMIGNQHTEYYKYAYMLSIICL